MPSRALVGLMGEAGGWSTGSGLLWSGHTQGRHVCILADDITPTATPRGHYAAAPRRSDQSPNYAPFIKSLMRPPSPLGVDGTGSGWAGHTGTAPAPCIMPPCEAYACGVSWVGVGVGWGDDHEWGLCAVRGFPPSPRMTAADLVFHGSSPLLLTAGLVGGRASNDTVAWWISLILLGRPGLRGGLQCVSLMLHGLYTPLFVHPTPAIHSIYTIACAPPIVLKDGILFYVFFSINSASGGYVFMKFMLLVLHNIKLSYYL